MIFSTTGSSVGTATDKAPVGCGRGSHDPKIDDPGGGMFLSSLDKTEERPKKTWLRFDVVDGQYRITVFADSGATHCFIARRVVDLLGLELEHASGEVRLEGGKSVDVVGAVNYTWRKGGFQTTTRCIVLDMENDLILGENFWQEYRLSPDYETLGVRVWQDAKSIFLPAWPTYAPVFRFSAISHPRPKE